MMLSRVGIDLAKNVYRCASSSDAPANPSGPKTRQCGFKRVLRRPIETATQSNGMDSSSPKRHLSATLVSDTTSQRKRGVHHDA